MAGKGSRARPLSITKSQFGDNWDAIFGNKSDNAKNVAKPADRTNTVLKNTNTNGKLTFEDWKATHLHILQAAEAKLANVTGIDIELVSPNKIVLNDNESLPSTTKSL